jgi:hypothetical protein
LFAKNAVMLSSGIGSAGDPRAYVMTTVPDRANGSTRKGINEFSYPFSQGRLFFPEYGQSDALGGRQAFFPTCSKGSGRKVQVRTRAA